MTTAEGVRAAGGYEPAGIGKRFIDFQDGYGGVGFGYHRFYVTNSEPSIERQFTRCLRHYHARVKGRSFASGEPVNFVTG